MIWKPVTGHPDLERSDSGIVRRIPTIGEGLEARPHPTKRVVLTPSEVAEIGLGADDVKPAERDVQPGKGMGATPVPPGTPSPFAAAGVEPTEGSRAPKPGRGPS